MAKRPNLIYVFADQLRFSSVGFNGDEYAHTPFLDSFSDACVNMENAVSGHPVCAPYRASLLTGKYTTGGTGMVINELRINPNWMSVPLRKDAAVRHAEVIAGHISAIF